MASPLNDLIQSITEARQAVPPADYIDRAKESDPLQLPPTEGVGRTRKQGPWRTGTVIPTPADYSPVARSVAQNRVGAVVRAYLDEPHPGRALLLNLPAGFGKTYLMVGVAEARAALGWNVFYAGPRRNFFQTIMRESVKHGGQYTNSWYEWLPRQDGSTGCETCLYPQQVAQWTKRGYPAIQFCAQSCGWPYISGECAYYEQCNIPNRLVYGTHPHVFLGNPLLSSRKFDLLIGDEEFFSESTLLNSWHIPAAHLIPKDMAEEDDLLPILRALRGLAESGAALFGPALLDQIGGARNVLIAASAWRARYEQAQQQGVKLLIPRFAHPDNAAFVADYNYLPDLTHLLMREAAEALADREYLHRVVVRTEGRAPGVTLFLRRQPHEAAPEHNIWLDATACPTLYEAALGRPVEMITLALERPAKLIQVADRANGISTVLSQDDVGPGLSHKGRQAIQQVERLVSDYGFTNYGVITYKDAVAQLIEQNRLPQAEYMHFGGNRGSNDFVRPDSEELEALFVIGTPMPHLLDLVSIAKMIWADRMEPFDETWSERVEPFVGTDYVYFKSGFWNDPALNDVLWIKREAEIIQSVYRSRFRCPVFLLSSLPIRELPPDEVWSIREDVFHAPEGADPHKWNDCLRIAEMCCTEYGLVTTVHLCSELEIVPHTAAKYIDFLIEHYDYSQARGLNAENRGRKAKGALRLPLDFVYPPTLAATDWAQILFHVNRELQARSELDLTNIQGITGKTRKAAEQIMDWLAEYAEYAQVLSGDHKVVIRKR